MHSSRIVRQHHSEAITCSRRFFFLIRFFKKDDTMQAYLRSLTVIPPKSVDDLRPKPGMPPIALRCTRSGCVECAKYEVEQQIPFEASLHVSKVLDWKCDKQDFKEFAVNAGVDELPAYIIVPPHPAEIRIMKP